MWFASHIGISVALQVAGSKGRDGIFSDPRHCSAGGGLDCERPRSFGARGVDDSEVEDEEERKICD